MLRSIVVFVAAACAATGVDAQESRLDAIQKSGTLRVCTPGDYQPFSLVKADGSYEGIDVDLVQSMAKALGVKVEFVKSPWPQLMDTFVEKCDIGVGGISVTLDRQKRAFFTEPYMVNGKAPITKVRERAEVPDRGRHRQARRHRHRESGRQQRAVRAGELQAGEDRHLQRQHEDLRRDPQGQRRCDDLRVGRDDRPAEAAPGLCAVNPGKPLQYGEMAYLLPRGDGVFKAWVDQWLHLAKATGDYDRTTSAWLK
jgi:cyclohexadienyl dehydratase